MYPYLPKTQLHTYVMCGMRIYYERARAFFICILYVYRILQGTPDIDIYIDIYMCIYMYIYILHLYFTTLFLFFLLASRT